MVRVGRILELQERAKSWASKGELLRSSVRLTWRFGGQQDGKRQRFQAEGQDVNVLRCPHARFEVILSQPHLHLGGQGLPPPPSNQRRAGGAVGRGEQRCSPRWPPNRGGKDREASNSGEVLKSLTPGDERWQSRA